jgi:hypothetical protein
MKKNTKLITAISAAAVTLSLIAAAAVSVSATQAIPTTAPTGVSTSNSDDWNNADNWSPDQIANFFKDSGTDVKLNQSTVKGSDPTGMNRYVGVKNNITIHS